MPVRYCSELYSTYTIKERSDVCSEGISNSKDMLGKKGMSLLWFLTATSGDTEINKTQFLSTEFRLVWGTDA